MAGALFQPAVRSGAQSASEIASAVKVLVAVGDLERARERFGDIVRSQQRRASRIAYLYLRDAADADEATQDAFVKAFTHLGSFKDELSFEVWFTRILINGCLDRLKARARRERWLFSSSRDGDARAVAERVPATGPSPEQLVLGRERRRRLSVALEQLPERQRAVFGLTHFESLTPREVGAVMGLNESTVRVHLFRAIRRLRKLLGTQD
jgi:RNA polymerase sigma-70 factor (ECF subfamily)